jgi:hypothetical protein
MYALVINGTIQSVGRLPLSARRLDNGNWVMGLATASPALVAACGYFAVLDMVPAYDSATEVLERGDVFLSDPSTPVVAYTIRPKTADELAADADAANRLAKGVNVGQAITWLRNQSNTAESTTATSGNAVAVLNGVLDNLAIFYDGFADLLEHLRLDQLGEG